MNIFARGLLIIEPLDNHLAELLHFIGRGGGENVCPVGCGEILPAQLGNSAASGGDAVGVAACCLCLQGVKGGEGLRARVVGDASHSVSYPNIKPNEADIENQRNGEK